LSSRIELRVEDVLGLVFAGALVAAVGIGAAASRLASMDEAWWDMSFIVAPMAALLFAGSVRFAFRPRSGGTGNLAELGALGTIVRDWLPFLVFLTSYESFRLASWSAVLGADRDAALLAIDTALFGLSPAIWIQRFASPALTDAMSVLYFLHLVLPPILATSLYRHDRRTFREFLLAVLVAGALGSAGYVLVPATGPGIAFPGAFDGPLAGRFSRHVLDVVDAARAPRDAFPSLHVGISTIVLIYAYRRSRLAFALALPLVLGNWVSTLYLRYHYFIDVVAGWAVAAASSAVARGLLALEARLRARAAPRLPA